MKFKYSGTISAHNELGLSDTDALCAKRMLAHFPETYSPSNDLSEKCDAVNTI